MKKTYIRMLILHGSLLSLPDQKLQYIYGSCLCHHLIPVICLEHL